MAEAIKILQREHANMLKVLAVLEAELKVFQKLGNLDLELLFTIVDYIETFPDKFHHPKEERYVFDVLAERDPEARPLIDELRGQHEDEVKMIAELRAAVESLSMELPMDKAEFQRLVADYVAFVYDHMRMEEMQLFPLAEKSLRPEDWEAIDREFAENRDPVFAGAAEGRYQELLRRIIYLSIPPPDRVETA